MYSRKVIAAILLAGAAGSSFGLTLGRVRGAAWIGQPLALSFSVQIEPGQTPADLCAEADVFYADSKVDSARVRVAVEAAAAMDSATVRVQADPLVDEPMVTVYLRAGCITKSTRRYVVLADYAGDPPLPPLAPQALLPVATAAALAPPAAPPSTRATPDPKPVQATGALLQATGLSANQPVPPAPTAKPAAPSTSSKPVPKPASSASVPVRARLKLDPVDNLAERVKTLEATTSAVTLEEIVKDSQRMQRMQSDMQALLAQAAKNEANMLALRERLEKSESERVWIGWVYLLSGLILVALGALFVVWNRREESRNWARAEKPNAVESQTSVHEEAAEFGYLHESTHVAPLRGSDAETGVDVNLMEMDPEAFNKLLTQRSTDHGALAPNHTPVAGHVHFNSERTIDLRLQAEFFIKLGKIHEALEMLEGEIRASPRDCPLVYLDLLQIAHTYSMKTDYRQFRDEFEHIFNARVPEFAQFKDEGRSLEAYPALLQHISALWPAASVMHVIEACMLRDAELMNAEPFDLAAFRELVTLHGLVYSQQKPASPGAEPDSQHVHLDI